ncbi:Membrane fusion protein (MFP) family protein [uncultured Gammaproteobacteria bacterium]
MSRRPFTFATLALVAAFTAWAGLAELDVVSTAIGEIVPATRIKAVQHLEGGIVAEILVEEGAVVRRGQPLIRLDPVRAAAELEELTKRLTSLTLDISRLAAEAAGAGALEIPPGLERVAPEAAAAMRDMFASRHKRIEHDLRGQDNAVVQRESELTEITLRLQNNRKLLEIVASQVRISENLLGHDLTNRMAHLDFLRQQQVLRNQIEADQAALPRAEASMREARERRASMQEATVEQARRDLAVARQSFDELSERVRKFQNIQERTVLRAPVDGIIKTLAVNTEGGVISPGQTVAEIVPQGDRLIIEARLPIQDIGYVHLGQAVRVTLNIPDAALYGYLDGAVLRVSPDATVTASNQTFYKIRIETSQNRFEAGGRSYNLYPGMQVVCGILLGRRTVAEYLLSPWFRSLRFAFQER